MIAGTPLALFAATALVLTLTACSPDGSRNAAAPAGPEGERVTVQGFRFQPDVLEVSVGATVLWQNEDNINHTATSGEPGALDGTFDVGLPGPEASGQHLFEQSGTFDYFCTVHESMTARIIVTD